MRVLLINDIIIFSSHRAESTIFPPGAKTTDQIGERSTPVDR